jgi:hypothetical protein
MLVYILIALAAIIAIILILAARKPPEFTLSRSAVITAPAPIVFSYLNDLHKWQLMSPWAKMDPNCKITYDGPATGTGASFAWAGNREVGEGRMTNIETRTNEFVRFRLDFLKPFACMNIAEFTFKTVGNQTTVTWTMFYKPPFIGRVFCLFMNMDKMIGGHFEQGLANLRTLAEAEAKK